MSEMNNQSPKKKSTIIRWIIGVIFSTSLLITGFHYSSLFLLCAALLMLPLPFITSFLQKINIKTVVAIILSVVLFFVGVITSPTNQPSEPTDNNISQSTTNDDEEKNNTPTKPSSTTSNNSPNPNNTTSNNTPVKPNTTTSTDEKVTMVWVSSSGKKYHSKSNCSNMKSPRQISLESAVHQGYDPCKNCH